MKKRMFRVLCVALALALLAPNVFAATPAPEVPLADEATVTRVKNEIATGQITDMEDVFLVAYQHLGADLEEDGMTAYINEDGTLGFTQIISSNGNTARSGGVNEKSIAVSSMALVDNDGIVQSNYEPIYDSFSESDYGEIAGISFYVTHTAYYNTIEVFNGLTWEVDIKMTSMKTTISYDTASFIPTQLVQTYSEVTVPFSDPICVEKITNNPTRGSYTFSPSIADYEREFDQKFACYLRTTATVYISNTNNTIYLWTQNSLDTSTDNG